MDDVIKTCKEKTKKYSVGYWKMRPICISELAFADDVALIAKSEAHLQYNLLREVEGEDFGQLKSMAWNITVPSLIESTRNRG
ncbi:unnamed protein product, partial [Candidula unifasciata]